MNTRQIKALVSILRENELTSLEVCEGETKVRIEKSVAQVLPPEQFRTPLAVPEAAVPAAVDDAINFNDVHDIKTPIVGVFYASPSPERDAFVRIGSMVKKGDVLCIVEAMKVMNEIVSDYDGEIVDICASNGDIVEYGQTLFKIY